MDPRQQRALDRLLAPAGGLSRPEKEAILARVLAGVGAQASPSRTRGWWTVATSLAMAAAFVLMLQPPTDQHDGFFARGAATGPQLTVLCNDQPATDPCPTGSELSFEVADLVGKPYVALYAKRFDGAVIWYAPAQPGLRSPSVVEPGAAVPATALVPHRVVLGPEHRPGRYEIVAVFSSEPLDRQQIKAAVTQDASAARRTIIVTREIWIR